jgi:hypothetical protein
MHAKQTALRRCAYCALCANYNVDCCKNMRAKLSVMHFSRLQRTIYMYKSAKDKLEQGSAAAAEKFITVQR